MRTYKVELKRDAAGWWVASVRGLPGCHTQARTLRQAEERIREALALFVGHPESAKLDMVLPARVRELLAALTEVRQRADLEKERAHEAVQRAVHKLTEEYGLSGRDAGELLGLSHQRVQQLREKARASA